MFRVRRNKGIQDEFATHEIPSSFDDLVDLALRVESRLRFQHQRLAVRSPWRLRELASDTTPVPPSSSPVDPEPMQLGSLHITPQQKQEQLTQSLCFYCGKARQFAIKGPLKTRAHQSLFDSPCFLSLILHSPSRYGPVWRI